MIRACFLLIPAIALPPAIVAQPANPMSNELRASYAIIKTNLLKMASKMPEDAYAFKPVPEIETFARRVAHIAGANLRTCAGLKGETKTFDFASRTAKPALVAALQESFAYCDGVFDSLTDQSALEMVNGRIGSPPFPEQRTRLTVLWNVVRHSNELYGYMAVYLRLKGVVPPSSSPD